MSTRAQLEQLVADLNGYRRSCLLASALQVGLLQALEQGERSPAQLSQELQLHQPSLERVLPALGLLGVVEVRSSGRLALTRAARLLVQGWMESWGQLIAHEYLPVWSRLDHTLRTGQAAFPAVFGRAPWEHRAAHPEEQVHFQRVMSAMQQRLLGSLLGVYDFSPYVQIVDLGGGQGELLRGLLEQLPRSQGTLFDLPAVVAEVTPDPEGRWRVLPGDLRSAVPPGGDLYLLKHVLHNWDDDTCRQILQNCRGVMSSSSRLLILESLPQPGDLESLCSDLHMLLMHAGKDRSLPEWSRLLEAARLEVLQSRPVAGGVSLLEVAAR